jgi:hypothetical protein
MMKGFVVLIVVIGGMFIGSCSKSVNPETGEGEVKMNLVDSPAGYDKVNIVVTRVEVHKAGSDTTSGWTVVASNPATYDLLSLRNGASAVLGQSKLTAGKYTQIRLIIGSGSNVVVDGVPRSLTIPSGIQSGVKLVHQFDIEPGKLYELTLDFDAARSITVAGSQYLLRPTIRVQANVVSGNIAGVVSPAAARASVSTVVGADTVSTLADTTSGEFKLVALPEGTYALRIIPSLTTYRDTTITGVVVVRQQDRNIGTVTLQRR